MKLAFSRWHVFNPATLTTLRIKKIRISSFKGIKHAFFRVFDQNTERKKSDRNGKKLLGEMI